MRRVLRFIGSKVSSIFFGLGVWNILLIVDLQCVDIGTKSHPTARSICRPVGRDPTAIRTDLNLETPIAEQLIQIERRLVFPAARFGMHVQMPAHGDHVGKSAINRLVEFVGPLECHSQSRVMVWGAYVAGPKIDRATTPTQGNGTRQGQRTRCSGNHPIINLSQRPLSGMSHLGG